MPEKLRDIYNSYINMGISPGSSVGDRERAVFIMLFGPPTWILLTSLVIVNFTQHHYGTIFVYLFALLFTIFNFLYLATTKNIKVSGVISILITFFLVFYIFFDMGFFGEGHVWLILFPVIAVTFGGFLWGFYMNAAFILSLIIIAFLSTNSLINIPYPTTTLIETTVVVFFAAVFSLFRQYLIESGQEELEKYKLSVDNASDHIVITDPDAHILYANAAASKITGYSNAEMVGKTPALWGHNMPKEFYEKMWKTIKTNKKTFEGEITNKRKDGQIYQAVTSISPILDSQGNIQFFVGIERDVTKERAVDRMKTEFVSLSSHQLRTPLTAVKWGLETVLNGDMGVLNEKQKEHLKDVADSNEQEIELVNSLLNVSRIESGRILVNPHPTNIVRLANNVVSRLKIELAKKDISLVMNVEGNPPELMLDTKLIENVYQNIIDNSVNYSPAGSKIILSISVKDGEIVSSIADEGIGVPENEKVEIFKKFYRSSNAKQIRPDGSGLGLYIAKSIVESSGGKIWLESSVGHGTTFFFTLPLTGMKAKEGEVTLT